MRFPGDSPVTEKKLEALRERIERLGIDLGKVDEQFVRAGGPGGQKVNKTSSAVVLRYPDPQVVVKCSTDRSRALNRFLALRELVDEIEVVISPETSQRLKDIEKIRNKKRRRKRRRAPKPDSPTEG
jgi:protein subunit release factor B